MSVNREVELHKTYKVNVILKNFNNELHFASFVIQMTIQDEIALFIGQACLGI